MRILFVCTGNICRSPMGELLLPRFLPDPAITADSAGTHGLPQHPIDPNSARILAHSQIDVSAFRSKRITPQIADDADLILGFEPHHISEVVSLAPRKSQRAFLLTDFANICAYCAQHDLLSGATQPERLISSATHASLIRPLLPSPKAIADPYRKEYADFVRTHNEICTALARIAQAIAQR